MVVDNEHPNYRGGIERIDADDPKVNSNTTAVEVEIILENAERWNVDGSAEVKRLGGDLIVKTQDPNIKVNRLINNRVVYTLTYVDLYKLARMKT